MWTILGKIQITHRRMNVKIGTETTQFPEKEYINRIFLAVLEWENASIWMWVSLCNTICRKKKFSLYIGPNPILGSQRRTEYKGNRISEFNWENGGYLDHLPSTVSRFAICKFVLTPIPMGEGPSHNSRDCKDGRNLRLGARKYPKSSPSRS